MKTGIELISEQHQMTIDCLGVGHDDRQKNGELAMAAMCYAIPGIKGDHPVPHLWPWDAQSWKPSDGALTNLIRAGALIAAEIDRLQRVKRCE